MNVFYPLELKITMLPELSELKFKRKQLNLTQVQLSELSKVSQSLIAKIESGKTIPSYENAKKLFDALEKTGQIHRVLAEHLMKKPVLFVHATDTVQKAIRLMQKNGISQLPVLENRVVIGTVSENGLLEKSQSKSRENLHSAQVKTVLEPALPQVPPETPIQSLGTILEHAPAALVTQNGSLIGIVSQSDYLKTVASKKITKHQRLI
ncbi:MAG: CBS domain-containing protein [Candidatus Micrarchaeota archaeon]